MFTGLIEEQGSIDEIEKIGKGLRLIITAEKVMSDLKIDDSISINGVCQTVVSLAHSSFWVVAIETTLQKTTFDTLKLGDKVNLERAVTLNTRLGGHIVQGHIDCVGNVVGIKHNETEVLFAITYPKEYSKYLIQVGSICINGVSLTVANLTEEQLTVAIIPHTIQNTTFQSLAVGDIVNLEFDMLAKYIENLVKKG